MKTRRLSIIVVAFLLLSMLSIMLIVFVQQAHEDFPENIRVGEDGKLDTIMTVQDLRLNPTEKREYDIHLYCAASGSYYISLDYEELRDGGMKQFVNVTVRCADMVIFEGMLTDLLDGDTVVKFEGNLESEDPLTVSVSYEMPEHIGNEAQGTSADFDIRLKIEKS